MIADYQHGKLDLKSNQFKILTGFACLMGLTVPVLGVNPIKAQIVTQVFNVFILPLVIIGIMILLNRKSLMGAHKAGVLLNAGMFAALVFACIISVNGAIAIFTEFAS